MLRGVSLFILILTFVILVSRVGYAQGNDTTTTLIEKILPTDDDADAIAPPDTLSITPRAFDPRIREALNSDPELQYQETPTMAESLWERFLRWAKQLIAAIFRGALTTNWGRLLLYVLGAFTLVVVIMMVLKVNAFKVFYGGAGSSGFQYQVMNDDIHEMDFEKLIQEAMEKQDYRTGVRLTFLFALKILSDKNYIHWNQGKTNHDYLHELNNQELRPGFHELNAYFEYAWYGDFRINSEMFDEVQTLFRVWKGKIA